MEYALGLLWSTSARPVSLVVQLLQFVEPVGLTSQVLRTCLIWVNGRLRQVKHIAATILRRLLSAFKIKQLQVLVECLEDAEVPRLAVIELLATVTHLMNLLQFEARDQDGGNGQSRVRILAPQAIDETLLDEVVDVLAILNEQYD